MHTPKREPGHYIEVVGIRYRIETAQEKRIAAEAIRDAGHPYRPMDLWDGQKWIPINPMRYLDAAPPVPEPSYYEPYLGWNINPNDGLCFCGEEDSQDCPKHGK